MPAKTSALVLGILVVCILWPIFRHLVVPTFAAGPWVGTALFLALPLLALRGRSVADLGLDNLHARGVAVGVGGSLAMVAAFLAFGHRPQAPEDVGFFLRGTILAAIVEEVLFRGYAMRQLHEKARWPLWAAIVVPAILFGLGHLGGALAEGEKGNPVMTVLVTGAGGAWFGWLLHRWDRSLWVPIAIHTAMNTWWLLFSGGATAGAGGPAALWGRVAAITLISVLTARLTKKATPPPAAPPPAPATPPPSP